MKTYDITSVEKALQTQNIVASMPNGISMRPLIRMNKDIVLITKATHPLNIGEVPLYRRSDTKKLVLHRIIGIKSDGTYIIRGDNTYHNEYIPQDDVVGVMVGIYRGKKYIDCATSKKYKIYVKLNSFFYPVRFVYKKILAKLSKIKRSIIKQ